jgi:hypothetical protein
MRMKKTGAGIVGTALTAGGLLVAGATMAIPAHADEGTYLSDMRNAGTTPALHDSTLLKQGRLVCIWARDGASPEKLERLSRQDLAQADGCWLECASTPHQAAAIVEYARADLCPGP